MDYYTAMRMNSLKLHGTIGINHMNITLVKEGRQKRVHAI